VVTVAGANGAGIAYRHRVTTSSRVRVLAVLVGLVAPVAVVSVGLLADSGAAAPARHHGPAAAHIADAAKEPAYGRLILLVNKKEVKKGKKVKLSGYIDAPDHPECSAGVVLTIGRATTGAVYKPIGTVTTDAAGRYSVKEKITKKVRFRLSAPGTDACLELQSPPRTVKLKK
jgi:hypothetical protein